MYNIVERIPLTENDADTIQAHFLNKEAAEELFDEIKNNVPGNGAAKMHFLESLRKSAKESSDALNSCIVPFVKETPLYYLDSYKNELVFCKEERSC